MTENTREEAMHVRRHKCCPMEATLVVIGGRWKGMIVYKLLDGPKRFGELGRLLPGVTQRMLTLQLRELEEDEVVHREIFKQIPPKVEYSLTEFGRSLEPTIALMCRWGEQYMNRLAERTSSAAVAVQTDPLNEEGVSHFDIGKISVNG